MLRVTCPPCSGGQASVWNAFSDLRPSVFGLSVFSSWVCNSFLFGMPVLGVLYISRVASLSHWALLGFGLIYQFHLIFKGMAFPAALSTSGLSCFPHHAHLGAWDGVEVFLVGHCCFRHSALSSVQLCRWHQQTVPSPASFLVALIHSHPLPFPGDRISLRSDFSSWPRQAPLTVGVLSIHADDPASSLASHLLGLLSPTHPGLHACRQSRAPGLVITSKCVFSVISLTGTLHWAPPPSDLHWTNDWTPPDIRLFATSSSHSCPHCLWFHGWLVLLHNPHPSGPFLLVVCISEGSPEGRVCVSRERGKEGGRENEIITVCSNQLVEGCWGGRYSVSNGYPKNYFWITERERGLFDGQNLATVTLTKWSKSTCQKC